jgi:hypothetical protein
MKAIQTLVVVSVLTLSAACASQQPTAAGSSSSHKTSHHTKAVSTSSAPSVIAECRTSDLRLSLANQEGTAGSTYVDVVLTNTSAHTCSTGGFGGVSFVGDGNGTQIGAAAVRVGTGKAFTLRPGEHANATLQETDAGVYSPARCKPTRVDGLRVYPPNQTASLFVKRAGMACASDKVVLLHLQAYKPA